MESNALDRQKEIYLNGFAGRQPGVPIQPDKLEKSARKIISPRAYAYIAGGAGSESTMRANRDDFDKIKIVPRMLNDVSIRNTSIQLLGTQLPSPFFLSPIGVLEMANKNADVDVAQAAAAENVPMIFSNQASYPMEVISEKMGEGLRFFQLYWSKSNDLVASFVQRAEQCGCQAIVVTLDTTMLGWRTRDLDLAYLPFLEGKGIAQYTSDPVFQKLMDEPDSSPPPKKKISLSSLAGLVQMVNQYPGSGFIKKLKSGRPIKAVQKFISIYSNPAITWDDIKFLRTVTKLPILLKGILHPNDALKAIDYGVDGIYVSNHGGRQVDGSISTIEALPAIAKAVNKQLPILFDSGIRGGADAFKALALGATAVGIGRPYVYALAINGENGVRELLKNFKADFELTMGLSGCRTVQEITSECVQLGV
jgi:lactate 2-monooxygenase